MQFLEGCMFNRGPASVDFLKSAEKGILELKNPRILLIDMELQNVKLIGAMLDKLKSYNTPIMIFSK